MASHTITSSTESKIQNVQAQAVANAKGIAQINATLEQQNKNFAAAMESLQDQLKGISSSIETVETSTSVDHRIADSKIDSIHKGVTVSQKIMIIFECICVVLMLISCLCLFKISSNNSEVEEKESVIEKYQEVLEEYGITFPEFPEFPEMNLYGNGE